MRSKIAEVFVYLAFILSFPIISYSQGKYVGPAKSMGSNINSLYDEEAPVLSPDGKTLYFTRSKHPDNVGGRRDPGDIWFSRLDSAGNWLPAQNAGPIWNNQEYNAIIGFFNNGDAVYLVGHYNAAGEKPVSRGISVSYKNGNTWSFPQTVEIKYYHQNSEHQDASLSADGQVMVMSVESYDSRGAEDIYVSFKRHDGTWTDIQILGPEINTSLQEMTPYIAPDDKTLLFASNGHGGEGSFDLFVSKRKDDTWRNWTTPVNLGKLINTNGRELYYFLDMDHQRAYYCSTMNSDGYGDIKYISIIPNDSITETENEMMTEKKESIAGNNSGDSATIFRPDSNEYIIHGKVLSSKTSQPLSGVISIFLTNKASLGEIKTDSLTGKYSLKISSNKEFDLKVSAKGYMNVEETINTHEFANRNINRDYYLEPLDVGRIFRLNNVLFQQSTATLLDSSYTELNLVYEMMNENPDINIELSGHTDNRGDAHKNLILSQERVQVVKDYLVNKGIDPDRITGKGYGGMYPIASNATEATRRLNRRVEFKIIRKSDIKNQ